MFYKIDHSWPTSDRRTDVTTTDMGTGTDDMLALEIIQQTDTITQVSEINSKQLKLCGPFCLHTVIQNLRTELGLLWISLVIHVGVHALKSVYKSFVKTYTLNVSYLFFYLYFQMSRILLPWITNLCKQYSVHHVT